MARTTGEEPEFSPETAHGLRMRESLDEAVREGGASLRRIAADFECSASTVLRALRQEGEF